MSRAESSGPTEKGRLNWETEWLEARVLRVIRDSGLDQLRREFSEDRWVKYTDFNRYVAYGIRKLKRMRLPRVEDHGVRALDIGCGTGVFMLALRELGYSPVGIDLPSRSGLLRACTERLQLEVIPTEIRKFEPGLTGLKSRFYGDSKFTVVTALGIQFDNEELYSKAPSRWGAPEYLHFLQQVQKVSASPVRLGFKMNKTPGDLSDNPLVRHWAGETAGSFLHGDARALDETVSRLEAVIMSPLKP